MRATINENGDFINWGIAVEGLEISGDIPGDFDLYASVGKYKGSINKDGVIEIFLNPDWVEPEL